MYSLLHEVVLPPALRIAGWMRALVVLSAAVYPFMSGAMTGGGEALFAIRFAAKVFSVGIAPHNDSADVADDGHRRVPWVRDRRGWKSKHRNCASCHRLRGDATTWGSISERGL